MSSVLQRTLLGRKLDWVSRGRSLLLPVLGSQKCRIMDTFDIYDDCLAEDPGDCPTCGASFQWVRPGKSQATCECWRICSIHGDGAISYHPPGVVTNVSGYFCVQCWLEKTPWEKEP